MGDHRGRTTRWSFPEDPENREEKKLQKHSEFVDGRGKNSGSVNDIAGPEK